MFGIDCRPRPLLMAIASLGLLLFAPASLSAWGREAHQVAHGRAIGALPKGLKSFFSDHRREMATFAGEEPWEEGEAERFAADRVAPFPFVDMPITEQAFLERYGEAGRRIGRLPWLTEEAYERLVAAYRAGRKDEILGAADELARHLTDLTNPLALTENWDGQRSGRAGLWARVTARLPEALVGRLRVDAGVAHLIDEPRAYLFSLQRAAYVWADNIVFEEELAARSGGGGGEIYFETLRDRLHPIVQERLRAAARAVASYWYTAWVAAGKPALDEVR